MAHKLSKVSLWKDPIGNDYICVSYNFLDGYDKSTQHISNTLLKIFWGSLAP